MQVFLFQRRRNDNINKICVLEGIGEGEIYGKLSQNAVFRGKFHDNKIWKFCEFYCQKFCCHLGGSYYWSLKIGLDYNIKALLALHLVGLRQ